MSDLTEAREAVEELMHPIHTPAIKQRRIDPILSAYCSALAGETPESLVEAAAKAMAFVAAQDAGFKDPAEAWSYMLLSERERYLSLARAAAPILRAPLLAEIESLRARITELEAR